MDLSTNQIIALIAIAGVLWVSYKVFTDQSAGTKDRDEAGFNLFD